MGQLKSPRFYRTMLARKRLDKNMKFEQIPGSTNENEPEKVEDTRLSEEEAHNEANILRARMKVSHHSGTIEKKVGRSGNIEVEPTAEDYDQALKEIENLRQLSEE